ncbi:MAG: hypothetical protein GQ542_07180 [Desulforhopalus sp.]|nr:hypothetical protein [Desulforhopalus sp.]
MLDDKAQEELQTPSAATGEVQQPIVKRDIDETFKEPVAEPFEIMGKL